MKDQEKIIKEKNPAKIDNELDILSLAKTIWEGRRNILISTLIFASIGLFTAMFSEKQYTASSIIVPQIDAPPSNLGGLSSLATLAGVNMDLNNGTNAISPMVYPMVVSSISFQLDLMNEEYYFDEIDFPLSLFQYYKEYYKPSFLGIIKEYSIELPGKVIKALKDVQSNDPIESEIIQINEEEKEVIEILEENLILEVNDNDGYIIITSRFHQAYVSAQVAHKAQQLLQEYVTLFKIEKASAQLDFINERHNECKNNFEEAQSKLAAFRDANKNISSEIMRTQEERLQYEYQLAFDIYSELSKQLEKAKIEVKENAPVFSVIEEVSIPLEKSRPKKALIIIVWLFMGIIFGLSWIFGKRHIGTIKSKWNSI